MRITYDAVSDKGLLRNNNEDMALVWGQTVRDDSDSFSIPLPDGEYVFYAIVCDGLGGYEGGEVASEMACESFCSLIEGLPNDLDTEQLIHHIKTWVNTINAEIIAAAQGNQMGCTLTGLLIYNDITLTLNIGDSRTYRIRYDMLKQLTKDHSERDRTRNPDIPSSVIYNCLGIPDAFIDINETRVINGDRFIICSDGLCDMIDDEAIAANSSSAQAEIDAALAAGGRDNVTVVILNFESDTDQQTSNGPEIPALV